MNGWFDFDRTLDEMESFRRRMDDLFQALEGRRGGEYIGWSDFPVAHLRDDGGNVVIEADVPGLRKEDLDVKCTGQGVTITGKRKVDVPGGYQAHRRERGDYQFSRSFSLGTQIDPDRVDAELRDGMLTITLPKSAEAQPRRIDVKA